MNNLFKNLANLRIKVNMAFTITSIFAIAESLILNLITLNRNSIIITVFMAMGLVFYIVYMFSLNISFNNILCFVFIGVLCSLLYFSKTGSSFSIIIFICIGALNSYLSNMVSHKYSLIIVLIVNLMITVGLIFVNPIIVFYIKQISNYLKNYPSFFTVVNNFYTLFFSKNLENIVFDTGIGGVSVIDNQIATGIRNIFILTTSNKGKIVSSFLSSQYIVNIFCSIGLFLNLFYKIDAKSRLMLISVIIATIISGNNLILSILLLLLNPISYIAYLFLIFLANIIVSQLDIRIGFINGGGLLELFKYIEKPALFMIVGVIFIALSYYVFELVFSKMNVRNNFFVDRNAKRIITSLGGLKNIKQIDDDVVIVKNPNLINILKLDCEIYNNKIILLDDDLIVLKEYL